MTVLKILISISCLAAPLGALAQEPQLPAPMTFQAWKDQQVLEAQNQVLRISARISALRASSKSTPAKKEPAQLANGKLKKLSESDTVTAAEQDLKRAQESLASANGLQFDDYVDVYIPSLADQPEALQRLSDKLTKEELAEIFKGLMRKNGDIDAKRNASIAESLSVNSRVKTP